MLFTSAFHARLNFVICLFCTCYSLICVRSLQGDIMTVIRNRTNGRALTPVETCLLLGISPDRCTKQNFNSRGSRQPDITRFFFSGIQGAVGCTWSKSIISRMAWVLLFSCRNVHPPEDAARIHGNMGDKTASVLNVERSILWNCLLSSFTVILCHLPSH